MFVGTLVFGGCEIKLTFHTPGVFITVNTCDLRKRLVVCDQCCVVNTFCPLRIVKFLCLNKYH